MDLLCKGRTIYQEKRRGFSPYFSLSSLSVRDISIGSAGHFGTKDESQVDLPLSPRRRAVIQSDPSYRGLLLSQKPSHPQ